MYGKQIGNQPVSNNEQLELSIFENTNNNSLVSTNKNITAINA